MPAFVSSVSVRAFKSFGAETSRFALPPTHGVVGVVGPNGAGKSNVLDALCWASGCPPAVLRVKTLRELVCHGLAPELCMVEFQICGLKGTALHTIRTSLTSDCNREYRIDGKLKTGQQVVALLHANGLYLDSRTSVIRQAQVTKVADNSSPDTISEVVADSSGLSWWMVEASRANEELASTRKAVSDIQSSIQVLRKAMTQDQQDQELATKADRLDAQIEAAAEGLVGKLGAQVKVLEGLEEEVGAARVRVGEEAARLVGEQGALERELKEAEVRLESTRRLRPQQGKERGGGGAKGRHALAQLSRQLAADEERLAALRRQLATAQALEREAAGLLAARRGLRGSLEEADQQLEKLRQLQEALEDVQAGLGPEALAQLEGQAEAARAQALELRQAMEGEEQAGAAAQQAVQAAEGRLRVCVAAREEVEGRWHAASERAQQLMGLDAVGGLGDREGLPVRQSMSASAVGRQLEEAEQKLCRLSMRKQVLQRYLPPSVAQGKGQRQQACVSSMGQGSVRQLHQCFTFRPQGGGGGVSAAGAPRPAQQQQQQAHGMQKFIKALATVAGGSLHVTVCNTQAEASHLMDNPRALQQGVSGSGGFPGAGGKLRIWPLDRISAPEVSASQRRAVQALGPGRAWVPGDLLQPCLPVHAACLRRAFGGMLIVADQETASQVSVVHRLACVTLDGLVSRPGSVSGGWAGRGPSPNEQLLANKLEAETLAEEEGWLAREVGRLREVHGALMAAEEERAWVEARTAEEKAAKGNLQAVKEAAGGVARSVERRRAECRAAEEDAVRCDASLAAARGQRSGSAGEAAVEDELRANAAKLAGLQHSRAAKVSELERVEDRLEEVGALLGQSLLSDPGDRESEGDNRADAAPSGACGMGSAGRAVEEGCREAEAQGEGQGAAGPEGGTDPRLCASSRAKSGEVRAAEVKVQELVEAMAKQRAEEEQQQREHQEAEQQVQQTTRQLKQAREASKQAAAQEQHLAAQHSAHKASRDAAARALQQLLASFPGVTEAGGGDGEGRGWVKTSVPEDSGGREAALQALGRGVKEASSELEWLRAARSKVKVRQVPLAEQLMRQERVGTLHRLTEQCSSLEAAVESLDQGIEEARKQVLQANEDVFAAVHQTFQHLCAMMLPSLNLSLVKTQACASKGLVVRFTRNAADAKAVSRSGASGVAGGESGLLEQLSGGQRTLVSLALLLAAAESGHHSSTLLLDEVDAALDEHNQRTVTRLLKDLACRRQVQVICVSHHVVVHRACDALVHLARDANGSTTAATAGQQAAAGPADVAASAVATAASGPVRVRAGGAGKHRQRAPAGGRKRAKR